MLWEIKQIHVRVAAFLAAVFQTLLKWSIGVLVRKLIELSFPAITTVETNSIWDVIFLSKLSFLAVAAMSAAGTIVTATTMAAMDSMTSIRSAHTGRTLRRDILQCAIHSRGAAGSDSDIEYRANDLITKVKVIEDFQAHDEAWLIMNWVILGLSFVLAFIFAWYAGIIAVAMFVISETNGYFLEKLRISSHSVIEQNAEKVNSRLLDVIKNGVRIRMMEMFEHERLALSNLEEESDEWRKKDAKLKFLRDIAKMVFIGWVPVIMALVAWRIIIAVDPVEALNTSFAILVTILLLDEAHKSIIHLALANDKQLGAIDSKAAIQEFISLTCKQGGETYDHHHTESNISTIKAEMVSSQQKFQGIHRPDANFVALENVVLKYPGQLKPALQKYSQSFERGKIHGLVGESGSGKSSTLKVLAELLFPETGIMRVWDGIRVAYLSQDQNLFVRTIRENITYGAKKPISDQEAWAALKLANIDKWVSSLPNNLDEKLTGGEKMVSGGQLQRLHLAHLFCTCQEADLVLLDECVSALDKASRDLLIDRLKEFLDGKTSIIVTHHSEMLRICDEVHEMNMEATAVPLSDARHSGSDETIMSLNSSLDSSSTEICWNV